jgi:tetratricopeptide (TPR) repeat protein
LELTDKSALAKARRHLSKGQYEKALAEYDSILKEEPFNAALIREIAEVQAGLGNAGEAKSILLAGAERFAKKGLFREVITLYNQVLKIDPFLVPAYIKLFEILGAIGMKEDARLIIKGAVELFQSAGALEELVILLEKIAELDRDDIDSRMALAETCLKLQKTELAMVHYESVLPLLKKKKLDDLFIEAAERIIYYKPENLDLCKELAVLQTRRGEIARAEKLLLYCYLHAPDDIEALDLLVEHFFATGKTGKAVSVMIEKAWLLERRDESKRAINVIKVVLDHDPGNEEAKRFLQKATEKKSRAKKPGARRKTPAPGAYKQLDTGSQARISLPPFPGESGPPAGARDLAREDLLPHELVIFIRGAEIFPDSLAIKEKLKDAYIKMGQVDEAIDQLYALADRLMNADPDKARIHLMEILGLRSDEKRAKAMLEMLGPAQRPTKKVIVQAAPAQADAPVARKRRASGPHAAASPPMEAPGEEPSKPWAKDLLEELSTDQSLQESSGGKARLSADDRRTNPIPSREDISGARGIARGQKRLQQMIGLTSSKMGAKAPSHFDIGIAYFEMGQWKEAISEFSKAAEDPEREAMCHSLIGNCWSKIGDYEKAIESFTTALGVKRLTDEQAMSLHYDLALAHIRQKNFEQALDSLEKVKSIDPEYKNVSSWIVAVTRMMDKASFERKASLTLIPSSLAGVTASPAALEPQVDAKPRPAEKAQAAVKSPAAAKPPAAEKLQPAVKPQEAARPLPAARPRVGEKPRTPAKPPEAAEEISEAIPLIEDRKDMELMRGLSRVEIGADATAHFDLGVAFMKMEQWPEAVEEFVKASNDPKIRGMCYNFMGNCLYNMGETEKAIHKYKTGLLSKALTMEQKASLCYDLAEAFLKMDNLKQALSFLERIRNIIPNFMDVNERINAITHYMNRHPEKK